MKQNLRCIIIIIMFYKEELKRNETKSKMYINEANGSFPLSAD